MTFCLASIEEYEAALAIARAIEERTDKHERDDDMNIVLANLEEWTEAYEERFFPIYEEVEE